MSNSNPYESPLSQRAPNAPLKRHRRSNLPRIVLPMVTGAVIGYLLGPMFARGPGDPTGHFVGTAVIGAAGLGVGVLTCFLVSRSGEE